VALVASFTWYAVNETCIVLELFKVLIVVAIVLEVDVDNLFVEGSLHQLLVHLDVQIARSELHIRSQLTREVTGHIGLVHVQLIALDAKQLIVLQI
jgi:hypothetical protein